MASVGMINCVLTVSDICTALIEAAPDCRSAVRADVTACCAALARLVASTVASTVGSERASDKEVVFAAGGCGGGGNGCGATK